ncbi:MAG: aminoacyl-tRNA hydrolase, partial [Planctomycetota bacterium]
MKLVVGIGNPGPEYAQTRHNCGFMTCDLLAADHGVTFARHRKWKSQLAELRLAGEKVLLLKPQTYVNRSGEPVLAALAFHKLPPEQLLVVTDDINLPLGTLRLRASGSAGGHNGLRDIEARIGRG